MAKGWRLVGTGSMTILLALAGCATSRHYGAGRCAPIAGDAPALMALPDVARGTIVPGLDTLAPFAELDASLKGERNSPPPYRELAARDCQCLAVQASAVGELLDRKAVSCLDEGARACRAEVDGGTLVKQAILRDAALEARNRSAGEALELFYRLAEAEGKLDVLKQSLAEIEDTLQTGERMKATGMQLGDDFEILRRRRVAVLDSNIELHLAIERLNAELRHMLKLGPVDEPWRIWPVADWNVVAESFDVQGAIALGLARKPELVLYRRLAGSLDGQSAPLVRGILGEVNALLAMTCQGPKPRWMVLLTLLSGPRPDEQEVAALCRQLQVYRIEREQAVADEIRQAVMTVGARLRQVAVAREEVQGWERRINELEAKAERGMSTFPERTTVALRRLEAQSALVEKVMAWNIARVKLAQAQGTLTDGCGPSACLVPGQPAGYTTTR